MTKIVIIFKHSLYVIIHIYEYTRYGRSSDGGSRMIEDRIEEHAVRAGLAPQSHRCSDLSSQTHRPLLTHWLSLTLLWPKRRQERLTAAWWITRHLYVYVCMCVYVNMMSMFGISSVWWLTSAITIASRSVPALLCCCNTTACGTNNCLPLWCLRVTHTSSPWGLHSACIIT